MCEKGVLVDSTCGMSQLCTGVATKLMWSGADLGETEHLTVARVRLAVVHVKHTTPGVLCLAPDFNVRETETNQGSVGDK